MAIMGTDERRLPGEPRFRSMFVETLGLVRAYLAGDQVKAERLAIPQVPEEEWIVESAQDEARSNRLSCSSPPLTSSPPSFPQRKSAVLESLGTGRAPRDRHMPRAKARPVCVIAPTSIGSALLSSSVEVWDEWQFSSTA
jgi:hypothetical protein